MALKSITVQTDLGLISHSQQFSAPKIFKETYEQGCEIL